MRAPYTPNSAASQLEGRRAHIAQIAENSARLAFVTADFTTTGLGQFAFPQEATFDIEFTERPTMAYGYVYDGLEDEDAVVLWPRSTGFVWDWHRNSRGLYVGAYVGVCVDTPVAVVPTPSFALEHHFSFSGIAIKPVPDYLLVG